MKKGLLSEVDHRPWPLPATRWSYCQHWRNAVFLHYQADPQAVQRLLPEGLLPATHAGSAWISLVAFDMAGVRPRGVPALPLVSDFPEVNLRTYVRHGTKQGVYFLRIEAGKRLSVRMARALSILPYRHAAMARTAHPDGTHGFALRSPHGGWALRYRVGAPIAQPSPLDLWLTERYCLYQPWNKGLQRYEIHHKPWPLAELELLQAPGFPSIAGIVPSRPAACRFSPGVKVLSWPREAIGPGSV